MELLELIQTLNAAHGPSGDEGGIREKLAELARPWPTRYPPTPWAT